MNNLEELKGVLKVVCQKIDDDLKTRSAEEWAFNHPLNQLRMAADEADFDKIKSLASHIIPAYFRRGERIAGYIQSGVISSVDALDLENAISAICRENDR